MVYFINTPKNLVNFYFSKFLILVNVIQQTDQAVTLAKMCLTRVCMCVKRESQSTIYTTYSIILQSSQVDDEDHLESLSNQWKRVSPYTHSACLLCICLFIFSKTTLCEDIALCVITARL